MTIPKRYLVALVALALAAGYVLAADRDPRPSPADRPILATLARFAKTGLWLLLVAEPPPEPAPAGELVHHIVGPDGHPQLDHREGW
jgi:hypothetical protein